MQVKFSVAIYVVAYVFASYVWQVSLTSLKTECILLFRKLLFDLESSSEEGGDSPKLPRYDF